MVRLRPRESCKVKIKHAYDTALADSQQEAAEVGPLQSKVATVAEDCERKILQIKQAERDDINTTKDMNKNLKKEIANQKLEILDLQAKVDKLGNGAREYHFSKLALLTYFFSG